MREDEKKSSFGLERGKFQACVARNGSERWRNEHRMSDSVNYKELAVPRITSYSNTHLMSFRCLYCDLVMKFMMLRMSRIVFVYAAAESAPESWLITSWLYDNLAST